MNKKKSSAFKTLCISAMFLSSFEVHGACHSAESGLVTVNTGSKTGLLYTPVMPDEEGSGSLPPVTETQFVGAVRDSETGAVSLELETETVGNRVEVKKSTTLGGEAVTLGSFNTQTERVVVTDPNATEDKAFYWAEYLEINSDEIGFIDEACTRKADGGSDSDNYFLRENDDHLGLRISYKVPTDLNVTDVRFFVYVVLRGI